MGRMCKVNVYNTLYVSHYGFIGYILVITSLYVLVDFNKGIDVINDVYAITITSLRKAHVGL